MNRRPRAAALLSPGLTERRFDVTSSPSPAFTAAPPRRQLIAATTLVIAVHAALIAGLPRLDLSVRPGEQGTAFETRLIAPPAPPAPQAPTEQPAAATPPPSPAAAPATARPARKRPRPPPATPAEPLEAPTPVEASSPDAELAGSTPEASPPSAAQPSLLGPRPLASFGGGLAPKPITLPLPADEAATALQLASAAGDVPATVPPAATLTYRSAAHFGGEAVTLTTTLNWRQDGRLYEARWALYGPRLGDHTRTAVGLLSPHGLMPVRAEFSTKDVQSVRFDYLAQQIHFTPSDTISPLQAGTQDRLSVLLQLGALLAADPPRYPVGSRLELPAAHLHGPGRWRFTVEAEEPVTALKGQELPTLRLVHVPDGDGDARIEVWLGSTIHYLPVRVHITEANGDTVEHTMQTAYTLQVPPSTTATP